ncbi:MAG: FkbM family methyltransferase [Candidatus Ornithospirochaeta sp.]
MNDFWGEISREKRPVVIYGTGDGAEKTFALLKKKGIRPSAVSSSPSFVRSRSFLGYKVLPLGRVEEIFGSDIVLVVAFGSHDKKVIDDITDLSKKYDLYMPDLLTDEDGDPPGRESLHKNVQKLEWAFSLLGDDRSREVFKSVFSYKVSGRIGPLLDINEDEDSIWDFLDLGDEGAFVDGGAYNGDTISLFLKKASSYTRIYGVEPARRAFRILSENHGKKENVVLLNAALSSFDGKASITRERGRGNHIVSGDEINVMTIDSILCGEKATLLKFDTEGEEENALEGARNTILTHKPKILLSAYHRHDDYWRLIEKIWSIRDDYTLYARKSNALPLWDFYYILK